MSHHFDGPTAIEDGRLNLLDVYVFPEAPGTSTLILTVNPDSGRSSPATFRADALYEFVIASDGGTGEDRALRMSFGEPDADGDQEMRVRYAAGGPSRPGLEGTELGVGHTGGNLRAGQWRIGVVRPGGRPILGRRPRAVRVHSGPGREPVPSRAVHSNPRQPARWPERHRHRPSGPGRHVRRDRRRRVGPDQPVRARSPAAGQPGGQSDVAGVVLPAARRGHRGAQRRFAGRRRRHVRRGRAGDCGARGRTSRPANLPAAGGPGPAGAGLLAATSDQQIPCCRVAGGCRRVVLAPRAGGL